VTVAIVDYRAGNLASVKKALDCLNVESVVTAAPSVVARADKIILPGVGHFAATAVLQASGLRDAILEKIERETPFLGICVGMQWLFAASEEAPAVAGLGVFPGRCERFPKGVKSPHVGWNSITWRDDSRLFQGLSPGAFVYFTHSYRAPVVEATAARAEYGGEFSAAVERENLFGVQFHPEKSSAAGLKLLENFCTI